MNKKFMLMVALLAMLLGLVPVVGAQAGDGITVAMSRETAVLVAGDWVEFTTTIRNNGSVATPPLIVHLSIAPVDILRHVDPEDWMPNMTQHLPALLSGESAQLIWRIHALFEGNFASFVTVLAEDGSLSPAVGAPLQIQVSPDNILPLKDVIPVAAVVPLFPLALLAFSVSKSRRRSI